MNDTGANKLEFLLVLLEPFSFMLFWFDRNEFQCRTFSQMIVHCTMSLQVTGELLDNLTSWDALRAALPVGTVSGASKVNFPLKTIAFVFAVSLPADVVCNIYWRFPSVVILLVLHKWFGCEKRLASGSYH